MRHIFFLIKHQYPSYIIMSVILIFNLITMVILLIQTSTLNKNKSSKLIENYYISDTIRRLCPKDSDSFSTNLGTLSKNNQETIVKLKNGYQKIFPAN